jgi:folate-binding protein YgfZ
METMHAVHAAHHAVLHEIGGKPLPLGYGDFAGEVEALERGAGIVDLEAGGVIGIRGPDAALFLNGVVTNNVKALPKGRPQDNLLCGNKGKILHALTLLRIKDDEYFALTEPGELGPVSAHLDGYHVREELQMGVAGLTRLDVIGPRAGEVLRGAGLDPAALIQPFGGAAIVCAPYPLGAHPRALVLAPAAVAPRVVEALLAAGARLAGYDAYDEIRIWARVPRFGVDYGTDALPAEAALYTHIAFDKGCYVGQEIHARQHHRGHANRKLVAVDVPEAEAAGAAVESRLFEGGENVGKITSLARLARSAAPGSPSLRRGIAMVRYATAAAKPPLALAADRPATVTVSPVATDLGVDRGL